jgi:hypothetical protein
MSFKKEWVPRVHVDMSVMEHVQVLTEESPDFSIDMAVLFWIITKRDWYGSYKDWCELPIRWFATQSHCRFERIVASIERLVSLGIIRQMSDTRRRHSVMKYMYIKIKPADLSEANEEPDRTDRVESEKAPTVSTLLKEVTDMDGIPITQVLHWNGETMEKRATPTADCITFKRCKRCGGVMHPTEGMIKPEYSNCTLCTMKNIIQSIDDGTKAKDNNLAAVYAGMYVNGIKQTVESIRQLVENAES